MNLITSVTIREPTQPEPYWIATVRHANGVVCIVSAFKQEQLRKRLIKLGVDGEQFDKHTQR